MELQEAIAQRRSIKVFKRDMNIDDAALYQAIQQATDAPNHGMREPWRVVHIAKDRLGDMSKQLTKIAFPNLKKKQEDHYNVATNLGGMLALVLKEDPRQKQNLENYMAFGAFTQNLMLLLHEVDIGTCWKTPAYIFEPEMRALFGVKDDESLVGFLYLTDLEDEVPHRERHLNNIIDKF
ncbi:nitroreductase [Staphylococcus equorum]|uniref:nitroreductase family protein n=1 Tax=Staphylococcus equorum TaxID=246432 RepID=UPI000D1C224C|nr:nitroreductase [Staphylococcus equorum]MDG0825370.1 nitroreductase [Staphylococcus equorum]PTE76905.1 nitroreductase [Staphylococcus equorum]